LGSVFTPRWIAAHVTVVIVAIVFVNLGFWQLSRADERELNNQIGESRYEAEAVPLGEMLTASGGELDSLQYRRATVTGEFVPEDEVLIRSQVYRNTAGFHVVTPLRLDDGSAVMVNRGWVPLILDQVPVTQAPPPDGEVTIEGWVEPTHERGALGPVDPAAGRLSAMNRVDLDRIQQQVDYDIAPVYLVELGEAGEELPVPVPPPTFDDDGPHLGYAIQWFGFALVGLFGYGFLLRRARTQNRTGRRSDPS
jgi:surfeit locus 1 family protein